MRIEWKTCFKVGISVFLLYVAITYWESAAGLLSVLVEAAFPLILGCAIAYVINIPMSFYERHYFTKKKGKFFVVSRRPVCMLGAFLTVLAVVILVVGLILPQLSECLAVVLSEFPTMLKKLLSFAEQLHIMPETIIDSLSSIDWKSQISTIIETLTSGIRNIVGSVISMVANVFSGIVTALVSVIFAIYLLAAKDKLYDQWKRFVQRYTNEKWNNKINYTFAVLNDCFHRYRLCCSLFS